MLLNDRVGTHRIENGADNYVRAIQSCGSFVQVVAHSKTGNAGFDKENAKQGFENSTLGEQTYYIRERACYIICVNSEEFAAELSCK